MVKRIEEKERFIKGGGLEYEGNGKSLNPFGCEIFSGCRIFVKCMYIQVKWERTFFGY